MTSCSRQGSIRRASSGSRSGSTSSAFLSATPAARQAGAQGARPAGVRVRRRFVSEGRCRLGRRPRAEADQGPRHARRRARAGEIAHPDALRPADRAGPRLRTRRARASADPLPARAARLAGRARAAPITRSTPTSSPRGRRAARRACSSRWRRAFPLVTTRVGQAPALVRDGENGLLADVDDVDGLAAGVQRVHDDSELARALARGRPADCRGARRRAPRRRCGPSCSTASSRRAAAHAD